MSRRTVAMSPEGNTHAPIAGPTPAEALQVARADLQAKNEEIDRWNAIAATTSDPQTLIDARAHAEIAGREPPPLQEAADVAQLVLKDAEDTSTLDPILPSILQADAQVVDTLDAFTTAAGMVGWASTQRDRAAFGLFNKWGLSTSESERETPFPNHDRRLLAQCLSSRRNFPHMRHPRSGRPRTRQRSIGGRFGRRTSWRSVSAASQGGGDMTVHDAEQK